MFVCVHVFPCVINFICILLFLWRGLWLFGGNLSVLPLSSLGHCDIFSLSRLDEWIPIRAHQVWSGVHRLRQLGETPPVFSIEGGPRIWDEHSPEGKPSTQRDIRFRWSTSHYTRNIKPAHQVWEGKILKFENGFVYCLSLSHKVKCEIFSTWRKSLTDDRSVGGRIIEQKVKTKEGIRCLASDAVFSLLPSVEPNVERRAKQLKDKFCLFV